MDAPNWRRSDKKIEVTSEFSVGATVAPFLVIAALPER